MNVEPNLKENGAVVHQLLKEIDTLLVTLETQTKLEMASQLELEMIEVGLSEEQPPSLEDDFLTDWF
jgi:hypothetical protein